MKILQLTTSLSFAGAEQIILDLAKGIENTHIAGLTFGSGELMRQAGMAGIPCHNLNMASKWDWQVARRLRNWVKQEQFDLVHTHLVHANTVGRWALKNTSVPVVSTIHIVEKRFRPWHTWAERFTASWASEICAVSNSVYEHAINRLHLPIEKIKVVLNGVDLNRFQEPGPTDKRDLDILFVGRLDKQKGLDRLLPALAALQKKKSISLCFVGEGPEESALKNQAQSLNVSASWPGFTDRPEDWYRRAKLVVVPSRWEGFGLTAAEALACGCQVIHSGVDSLSQVCGPLATTFPRPSKQWASCLHEELESFSENKMRRQWVQDHFSRERMVHDYLEIYGKILQ